MTNPGPPTDIKTYMEDCKHEKMAQGIDIISKKTTCMIWRRNVGRQHVMAQKKWSDTPLNVAGGGHKIGMVLCGRGTRRWKMNSLLICWWRWWQYLKPWIPALQCSLLYVPWKLPLMRKHYLKTDLEFYGLFYRNVSLEDMSIYVYLSFWCDCKTYGCII